MAVVTAVSVVTGAVFLPLAQARKDRSGKKQPPKIIPIQSQISVLDGQTVITMSGQAEKLAGIVTARLKSASGRSGLKPGTGLNVRLPVGRKDTAVAVPNSAVVWAEGKPWVYQETAPGRFVRRPVEATEPHGKGIFVRLGLSPGDKIVVRGAQVLLSQEIRSKIHSVD